MTEALLSAASLIREAIQLLDGCDAPADIAAHLDLALARIDTLVGQEPSEGQD